MTIGHFAPRPPARTGVSDYAEALARELERFGEIRWNDAAAPALLYHIGNNHLHRAIYDRALERPGVIVLHDAVLHHFFLGTLDEEAYVREFVYNYGDWHIDLARRLWRNRARSGVEARYFEYPMLRRIVERSKAVVVHNPAAARAVRRHMAHANVVEIPHLFAAPQPPPGYAVERVRSHMARASAAGFIFGVFGHLRESKRLPAVLRAFAAVRRAGARAALLIAGDFASSDLARCLDPLLRAPGILRAGFLPEPEFWTYAAAVDACINLRYPAAGETSGIGIRLMGAGKPVITTASEESASIPDAAIIRIDHGVAEEAMLASLMLWLVEHQRYAREIGDRARRYLAERHDPGQVAARYWDVLSATRG
jgi:glycosyltransferase involved in cell wall biosynthesis